MNSWRQALLIILALTIIFFFSRIPVQQVVQGDAPWQTTEYQQLRAAFDWASLQWAQALAAKAELEASLTYYLGGLPRTAYVTGFTCLGDMRPTLDCGDEGVWVRPASPANIIIGLVIHYAVDEVCWREVLHQDPPVGGAVSRVTYIVRFGGTTYYQTRGDFNAETDTCLVAYSAVKGVLTEIRSGVRPQDRAS